MRNLDSLRVLAMIAALGCPTKETTDELALSERGIDKCHLMVLPTNTAARAFWHRLGWQERPDVVLMSHVQTDRITA